MKNSIKILVAVWLATVVFSSESFGQKQAVLTASKKVLSALKSKNTNLLASYVHPKKGVKFAPYSFFAGDSKTFKKREVANLRNSRKIYEWGSFDGTGEPIKMNFSSYYKRFIFNRDYAKAKQIGYNKIQQYSNTVVDIDKVFPRANFVEYYFPKDEKNNEMGWSALRLIFERYGNRWYLVGIGHGQWTI